MSSDDDSSAAFDEALEQLFSGAVIDVEAWIAAHPGLSPEEARQLRVLAGGSAPSVLTAGAGLASGAVLGEFRLIEPIGEGGMGVVWLAAQPALKRRVAVKVLHATLATTREARERLLREAEALGRVQHPHVVAAISAGECDGVLYVVMEYVPGRGLDELLAAGPSSRLPAREALRIARDVALGLAAAHAAGVIHRDVKPSNIRLTPDGRAILTDFGLARGDLGEKLTLTGMFRGTPHYASPEQVEAQAPVDARTDVWSLGATLYELLTGQPPFPGSSSEQVLNAILTTDVTPLRRLRPDLPREVETVVGRALDRAPAARFDTAADLAADLDALLDLRPIRSRPPTWRVRLMRGAKRHPLMATAAGVLTLTLLVLFAVEAVRRIMAHRALDGEMAAAAGFLASDDAQQAAGALVRARAIDSEDERLAAVDERVARLTRLHDARRLVAAAQAQLGELRARQQHAVDVETELRKLRLTRLEFRLSSDDERRLERLDGELPRVQRQVDDLSFEIQAMLTEAAKRAPDVEGADEVRCGLYLERFFEAERTGDARAADAYREMLTRTDHSGSYRARLAGGTVTVRVVPTDAEIHELRYRDLSALVEGQPRRLVAVPSSAVAAAPSPGALVARIVSGADAALGADDLVIGVDGVDWSSTATLTDLGGKPARVWHEGAVVNRVLPPGIELRVTAAPLVLSSQTRVGVGATQLDLESGSYVLIVRRAGYETQRIPLEVRRGQQTTMTSVLRPAGFSPPGFVMIPAGPATVGGDEYQVRMFDAVPQRTVDVPEFWIQEHEVTWAEYVEFLNAMKGEASRHAPHSTMAGETWAAELVAPPSGAPWQVDAARSRLPARGINCTSAEAYARWRTADAERRGIPWTFRIPSEFEWEKAARGADGRFHPFGAFISQSWTSSVYATDSAGYHPVLSFPIDESPYGVFDLAGSVSEWTKESLLDPTMPTPVLHGGSMPERHPEDFSTVRRLRLLARSAMWRFGFRLVAEPSADQGAASRPDSRR